METALPQTVGRAAGFWRRFVAALIDGVVVTVVTWALSLVLPASGEAIASLVVSVGYFTWFHGSTGQTPGDAALSIRVVDIDSGEAGIGYGRAALRWLVSIVSGLIILLGYLWMLWDRNQQTWHDKAARTVPVEV